MKPLFSTVTGSDFGRSIKWARSQPNSMTLQIRAFKKLAMSISTLSANADVIFSRWQSAVDRTLTDAKAERLKQLEKWGPKELPVMEWLGLLMEEVGEAARELNQIGPGSDAEAEARLRAELIQVAAVALAAVQQIDEGKA